MILHIFNVNQSNLSGLKINLVILSIVIAFKLEII